MAEVTIEYAGKSQVVVANGNGRLDAVSNAIKQFFNVSYELTVYEEHSLSKGSSSKAMTYVGISCNGKMFWGVGVDEDIIKSSIAALTVAANKLEQVSGNSEEKDERLIQFLNYIQNHYKDVTLDDLSRVFYLSKPYISKFIKQKSGETFGDILKKIRLKKAKTLLKNGNLSAEMIAAQVGYQNVEHFTRLFKKEYGVTPIQYRNQR